MPWPRASMPGVTALADATIGAAIVLIMTVLVVAICGQPARRLQIARVGMLAALALLPLRCLTSPHAAAGSLTARIIAALCVTGAVVGVAWLMLMVWGTRRILRNGRACSQRTRHMLAELCEGRMPRVRVSVSDRAARPVIVGFLRPVVVLPAGFEAGRDQALRLVLAHELVHAERSDHRWAWLGIAMQGLWFYFPMCWWLRAQMRLDEELLADCEAARHFPGPSAYAAALLALVPERESGDAGLADAARMVARRGPQPTLSLRMLMLMHRPSHVESRPPLAWSMATCLAAAGVVVLLSQVSSAAFWKAIGPAREVVRRAADYRVAWPWVTVAGMAKGTSHPVRACLLDELPEHFELSFQAEAQGQDLSHVCVLGLPLRDIASSKDVAVPSPAKVKFTRDESGLRLWVNDREIDQPVAHEHRAFTIESTSREPVHLRNVTLRGLP